MPGADERPARGATRRFSIGTDRATTGKREIGSGEVDTTSGEAESAGAESEENPDTDLEASFMEEGETLQDLDEFDYEPEDREAIISEDESVLSEPSFPQSKERSDFSEGKPEEDSSSDGRIIPGPAVSDDTQDFLSKEEPPLQMNSFEIPRIPNPRPPRICPRIQMPTTKKKSKIC